MEKVLFVIDMQEIYVGRGRNKEKYPYDAERLIEEVNKRIAAYKPEEVFYIKSIAKGLGGLVGTMPKDGTHEAKFAEKLKMVKGTVYEKAKPDAFSLNELGDFLRSRNVKEVEFAGVDGGGSVGATAVSAIDNYDLRIIYNDSAIGTVNTAKAIKYREKMRKNRVTFVNL